MHMVDKLYNLTLGVEPTPSNPKSTPDAALSIEDYTEGVSSNPGMQGIKSDFSKLW